MEFALEEAAAAFSGSLFSKYVRIGFDVRIYMLEHHWLPDITSQQLSIRDLQSRSSLSFVMPFGHDRNTQEQSGFDIGGYLAFTNPKLHEKFANRKQLQINRTALSAVNHDQTLRKFSRTFLTLGEPHAAFLILAELARNSHNRNTQFPPQPTKNITLSDPPRPHLHSPLTILKSR
jgi:hypothetical protein